MFFRFVLDLIFFSSKVTNFLHLLFSRCHLSSLFSVASLIFVRTCFFCGLMFRLFHLFYLVFFLYVFVICSDLCIYVIFILFTNVLFYIQICILPLILKVIPFFCFIIERVNLPAAW